MASNAFPRDVPKDWSEWVSATKTRNFMKEDPILDWLDYFALGPDGKPLHGHWHGYRRDDDPENKSYLPECDFGKFVMAKGIAFEAGVIGLLKDRIRGARVGGNLRCDLPEWFQTVSQERGDVRDPAKVQATLDLMRQGAPVIYQAVLWDWETQTYGMPDLIVRSDALALLFDNSPQYAQAAVNAPGLGTEPWHYVVVDVKFTTLHLDANGTYLQPGQHAEYMAQVALYSAMLSKLQGLDLGMGFLLGRSWQRVQRGNTYRGDSCLDRLGGFPLVSDKNNWLQEGLKAVAWIRRMRREGAGWTIADARTIVELRPSMGNTEDQPWHPAKKKIAEELGELTLLWQVNPTKRNQHHQACQRRDRLCRWDDPCLTPANLGVNGQSTSPRLQAILDVQRSGNAAVQPERIGWGDQAWRQRRKAEFFVDFETVSNLDDDFAQLPQKGGQDLVFMIGCGHFEPKPDGSREWTFKCFTAERLAPEEELRIFQEWTTHMAEVKRRLDPQGGPPLVFHWSPAETSTAETGYRSARSRHEDEMPHPPEFYDFLGKVVKPTGLPDCVTAKGALGFGLKAFGKALNRHFPQYVPTEWKDGPTDGLGAMVGAWWCYAQSKATGTPVLEVQLKDDGKGRNYPTDKNGAVCRELFRLIVEYNEVDCKVMQECIDYLRDHH